MRKLMISAALITLVCGTGMALAQDRDRGPQGDHGGAPHAGGQQPHAGPATSGPREYRDAPAMHAAPATPASPPANAVRTNNNEHRDNNAMRGPAPNNAMRGAQPNNNAMRGSNNGPRPGINRPANEPNNAMRGQGPRRDFSSVRNFHQNFRAARRFHAPAYRRPPGWYAHTWAWGQILPAAFWPRDYWLTDFGAYDLPPPPFGAIWVRVGDDALLIDQDSGEIIEVDYGIFY